MDKGYAIVIGSRRIMWAIRLTIQQHVTGIGLYHTTNNIHQGAFPSTILPN
jgi:hypothetical protein